MTLINGTLATLRAEFYDSFFQFIPLFLTIIHIASLIYTAQKYNVKTRYAYSLTDKFMFKIIFNKIFDKIIFFIAKNVI